jgi:PAS domain S-box-containing protein
MENALRNGKKLFEEGSLRNVEYILTKKDGTRFYAETSLTLIYDTENKPEGFMGVLRDITERKKAEEELSQTKALLEAALEQTDAGIVVASAPDSRLKIVNSKTLEILGVEDETVLLNTPLLEIKQSWRDFRPDGSEIKMEEHPLALSLRGIKSENVEDRIVRKDGTERWILVNGTPILNKKGEIIAGFLIFTDITEHKLFEKSLEQEKERLAVTLRSIGDGVITTDTSGRIVLINKIAEELTGWKSEEAIGKLLNEVFHIINEISREERENPVDIILRTGNKIQLANHTSLISKNGTEKIIADSGSPIIDKEGKILGVVIVFRDITEKQKLEKEILKIQKLESIGILAGGIAHDFNNILTSIMGNLSIAKMTIDVSNKEKIIDLLTKTEKASLRAKDLTQQLLTFAKGGSPILKSGSMEDVLRDSINFALRGSNIKSEITIENLWTVEMDEGQVSQVIQNLIINADQAMPQGGTIKVKAENILIDDTHKSIPLDKGKYIKVSIEDQGIGIPADYLSKIFDPYFTTKPKGSGLGLASSYSIINKHGGVITAESKLGKGSKFTFYLPASEKKVEQEEPVSETIKTGEGNILILDDEESIREMLMEILTSLGYTADSVADGLEAVELYKKALNSNNPYDLVIADLTVPGGMGGKETLSELLKIDPNAKVIVSSGYSTDPIMSEYWKYGFKGIITKPYGMEEVSKVLHGIVNK